MPATKSGLGIGGYLKVGVALGVLGVAAWLAPTFQKPGSGRPLPGDFEQRKHKVTLSAVWSPQPRDESVMIKVSVDGRHTGTLYTKESPWNETVDVPIGKHTIMVQVYQPSGGDIDCFVTTDGVTTDHSHRVDPGSIRCYYPLRK